MYNWKDTRNYRRFRDENGNDIAVFVAEASVIPRIFPVVHS